MVQNALQNYKAIKADPEVSASKSWYDVAQNYKNNFGPDVERELTNYLLSQYQSNTDPVGTIQNIGSGLYDLGVGVGSKALGALGYNPTGDVKYHREETIDNVIENIKNTLTEEGLKQYISEHPARATATALGGLFGAGRSIKGGVDFLNSPDFVRLLEDESGAVRLPGAPKTPAPPIKPEDTRVSVRLPSGPNAIEDPFKQHLTMGLDDWLRSSVSGKNVNLLSNYPGYARLAGMDPQDAIEAFINQGKDNLVDLYHNAPKIMQDQSTLWYPGANANAEAFSEKWGIPRQAVSAGISVTSPQKNFFENMAIAEQIGDILFGPAASKRMTPEMVAQSKNIGPLQSNQDNALALKNILGKRLSDLTDPLEQAIWVRLYGEAHLPRTFRSITPEGNRGDFMLNEDGTPSRFAWQSFKNIGKAIQAYQSGGDMNIISPLLGKNHKVRSFHNNIENPYDRIFGDVTSDTHQVAATLMRPLSANTPEVAHNFGLGLDKEFQPPDWVAASNSKIDGVRGTYGLYNEAARRASEELNLLPLQTQSATWEPVRTLFTDTWKSNKDNVRKVDDVWRAYDQGHITIKEARDQIYNLAGGIKTPDWARSGSQLYNPKKSSTYR